MKITGPIPENILKRMSPEDRAPMGKAGVTFAEATEKALAKSEKELQNLCANLLRQLDVPFQCTRMDRKTGGTVGWPDFTFPYRGKFYGVEFKVGANRPTLEQSKCLLAIEANGGIAVVIRDFESFVRLLK